MSPHTLRHAFITAALDAGVSLRDVQQAASHADPRTTTRYDRARASLDRHATHIVAAHVAGAARQELMPQGSPPGRIAAAWQGQPRTSEPLNSAATEHEPSLPFNLRVRVLP
jgi:Phage integrase family